MADETIKLIKSFLNNQDSNIDRSFSELIPKRNRITINEFFDYYNNLFYDIPKQGALSHKEIVDRSIEYLGNYTDPRDAEIIALNSEIDRLTQRVNSVELGEFESEFNDLTTTVVINIRLKDSGWPKNFDRVLDRDRTTHRLIFDDYVTDPKYIDNSYNYFQNKTLQFNTTSPTFRLWYSGFNDVKNNDDPVAWRTSKSGGGYGDQIYAIPTEDDVYIVDLTLPSAQAHNAPYPPSWTPSSVDDVPVEVQATDGNTGNDNTMGPGGNQSGGNPKD